MVGVTPPGVHHVGGDYRSMPYGDLVHFWWPVTLRPNDERGSHYLNAVGRLKPGITQGQASADLNVIAERLARQFPDTNGAFQIRLQALREEIVGRARTTLLVVFGAVFLVLLIACVNVANLLLARASAREREMTVRSAVGAARWQIVRRWTSARIARCFGDGRSRAGADAARRHGIAGPQLLAIATNRRRLPSGADSDGDDFTAL